MHFPHLCAALGDFQWDLPALAWDPTFQPLAPKEGEDPGGKMCVGKAPWGHLTPVFWVNLFTGESGEQHPQDSCCFLPSVAQMVTPSPSPGHWNMRCRVIPKKVIFPPHWQALEGLGMKTKPSLHFPCSSLVLWGEQCLIPLFPIIISWFPGDSMGMQFPTSPSGYTMEPPSPQHKMHPPPACWHFPNVPKCPLQVVNEPSLGQKQWGPCELRHLPCPPWELFPAWNCKLPHLGRPQFSPYSPPQQFQLPVNVSQSLRGFFRGFPFILILKLCAFVSLKLHFSLFL